MAAQPHPTTPARSRASPGDQGSPRKRTRLHWDISSQGVPGRVCGGWGQTCPRVVVQGFPIAVSGSLHGARDSRGDVLWASPAV